MTLDVYSACIATLGIVLQAVVVGVLWPYLKRQRAVGIKAKKDSEAHSLLNHLREKAKNEPEALDEDTLRNLLGFGE